LSSKHKSVIGYLLFLRGANYLDTEEL
jgi:hypothetical protein